MRKLKRKKKTNLSGVSKAEKAGRVMSFNKDSKKLPKIVKKKRIKKYKRQQCAYVKNGKQCKKYAVGKGTLCEIHGGDVVVKDNLVTRSEEYAITDPGNKYDPAYHPIAYIDFAREGLSEIEIAAQFEISIDSLKRWIETYESFNTAHEIGAAMHEAWYLRQAKDNLNERSFNTHLFKFLTMNKLGFSDKVESKNMNMNVHGVLMIPDPVSESEWEADEEILDV